MRQPVRVAIVFWAVGAVLCAWLLRQPLVGWLVVAPFLVLGPGVVASRLVSPEDRRSRWPIVIVAGFALLAIVSEMLAVAGAFRAPVVVTIVAALTLVAMSFCPEPSVRFPVRPRREVALPPGSHAVLRMNPGRRDPLPTAPAPVVDARDRGGEPVGYVPSGPDGVLVGAPSVDEQEWRELVAMISSPTLAPRLPRRPDTGTRH
jgi:hypothetical protein